MKLQVQTPTSNFIGTYTWCHGCNKRFDHEDDKLLLIDCRESVDLPQRQQRFWLRLCKDCMFNVITVWELG